MESVFNALDSFKSIISIIGNNLSNFVDFIVSFGKVLNSFIIYLPYPLQPILFSLSIFLVIVILVKVVRLFV